MSTKWSFDLYAHSNGMLAVLPFGELKTELRKQPRATSKLIELAANKAYETTYFNVVGAEYNSVPHFVH